MQPIRVSIFISLLLLTACTALTPTPTVTVLPPPSETPMPTQPSTPTATTTPTATSSPEGLSMPAGTPAATWEGFPIMPEALAGEDHGSFYTFTIAASPQEVQDFYESVLSQQGLSLLAQGNSPNGSVLLIFSGDAGSLSISIIPQPHNILYVMLVKE